MFEKFKNLIPLSKTIVFSLIPTQETEKNIEENREILDHDLFISKKKNDITNAFDEIFLKNISKIDNNQFLDDLKNLYNLYILAHESNSFNRNESIKNYNNEKRRFIDEFDKIARKLNEDLFGKDTLKTIEENSSIDPSIIKSFYKGNLKDFIKNREQSIKDIAKRMIVNIELMAKNQSIVKNIPEIKDNLLDLSMCLYDQKAIDKYNEKIAYLNQKFNEDYQKGILNKKYKLAQLQKSVLSNASSSFFIEQYKSNEDVYNGFDKLFSAYNIDDMYITLVNLFKNYENYDLTNIYIKNSKIHNLSNMIYNNHNYILNKIHEYAVLNFKSKSKQEAFEKQNFSINFINNIVGENIFDKIIIDVNTYKALYNKFMSSPFDSSMYLEQCLNLSVNIIDTFSNFVNIFDTENIDLNFRTIYDRIINFYNDFNKIFNCTRNFASKKNEYIKSYHLSFNNVELGNGWSESKLNTYKSIILIKNGKYYFGYLINAKKSDFETTEDTVNSYKRIVYMQFSNSNKQLPRIIFIKEVKNHFLNSSEDFIISTNCRYKDGFIITKEIYDIYCNKTYKTVKKDRDKYINFIKDFLINHYENRSYFDFSGLKDEYDIFDDFIKDVEYATYSINHEYISDACIEKLQKENKLWLFRIYNQDFSEHKSKDSNKNIHTLIFETFFSDENKASNYPIKLNGGFELRYRERGITDGFVHKKGSILLNKNDRNGNRIPDTIYTKLFNYVNDKKVNLNDDDLYYIKNDLLITHVANYDIIKDKRFSHPQFEIHITFTINSNQENNSYLLMKLNDEIDEYVKENQCNIIGIDRGERNLLCVTVIDGKNGSVIDRINLDVINGVNYNEKLSAIQKDRTNQRKNWKQISGIKDMKKGYLSYAVKAIVDLVEKYDAIIALENLNIGFKNSRSKIEKSLYQQFENQLINKLSYMIVDKKSSILNAKQLAFIDCKDINHNGIVYYINPSYTSKIDNTSGFANVFDFNSITNHQTRESFFKKMDISYDGNDYVFKFKYNDFDTVNNSLDDITFKVSSHGDRIKNYKDKNGNYVSEVINLTDKLNEIIIDKSNVKDNIINDEKVCKEVFDLFKLIVKMRNTDSKHDYLISPVLNKNGNYYDTRSINSDPDMEASYNIAIKAMLKVYHDKITLEDYFNYYVSK